MKENTLIAIVVSLIIVLLTLVFLIDNNILINSTGAAVGTPIGPDLSIKDTSTTLTIANGDCACTDTSCSIDFQGNTCCTTYTDCSSGDSCFLDSCMDINEITNLCNDFKLECESFCSTNPNECTTTDFCNYAQNECSINLPKQGLDFDGDNCVNFNDLSYFKNSLKLFNSNLDINNKLWSFFSLYDSSCDINLILDTTKSPFSSAESSLPNDLTIVGQEAVIADTTAPIATSVKSCSTDSDCFNYIYDKTNICVTSQCDLRIACVTDSDCNTGLCNPSIHYCVDSISSCSSGFCS